MMMICLRSVKLGLLSMLPNIVPILIPMGLMGVLGFNMSIVLMIFPLSSSASPSTTRRTSTSPSNGSSGKSTTITLPF